jgi:hypothetical protein
VTLRTELGSPDQGLQRRAGALHEQVAPQPHFGPQVQGWHEHSLFEHLLVI